MKTFGISVVANAIKKNRRILHVHVVPYAQCHFLTEIRFKEAHERSIQFTLNDHTNRHTFSNSLLTQNTCLRNIIIVLIIKKTHKTGTFSVGYASSLVTSILKVLFFKAAMTTRHTNNSNENMPATRYDSTLVNQCMLHVNDLNGEVILINVIEIMVCQLTIQSTFYCRNKVQSTHVISAGYS